jgi:hypothetical protein
VADNKGSSGGEGLSLQTLVIAAAASAAAAIIVSHVWKDGTVIAAAMTPVIVSVVKEMLARPMESELVKKPVKQVSRIASGRRPVAGRAATRARPGTRSPDPTYVPPPTASRSVRPDPAAANGDAAQGDPLLSPRRTYGRPRRRLHVKVAVVTGLLAFVIAALVLTVPELLFGGAVSGHRSTTFFGGGSSKTESKKKDTGTTTQPDQSKPRDQTTTPATPPPTTGDNTQTTTTPAPTTPQQTTPQQTSPVPPAPSPPTP